MKRIERAKSYVVSLYLFLILGVFPLYYQDKYFNMGDAKYQFFQYVTLGTLLVFLMLLAFSFFVQKNRLHFGFFPKILVTLHTRRVCA